MIRHLGKYLSATITRVNISMNPSKTFCMHPFTGLATREDGAILACCRSDPVGWIQDNTLEEIWNGKPLKQMRKKLLNDQWPSECVSCQRLEASGVESLRQRHIAGVIPESRITLYPNALDSLEDDFTMPFNFPTMEIKLNNLCNLKCRMCSPKDSTAWNDWEEVRGLYNKVEEYRVNIVKDIDELNLVKKPYLDKFEDNPNWWASFEKLLPHFRRVEFAGGEPLMDPQHYRILDMLAPYGDQIEIKYATNLTMLGKNNRTVWEYWPKFKSVAVNVSIDGIGTSYEYIRGNASWTELINNIKQIQTIPNISRIVGAVAVQISNAMVLDKMIEYFLDDIGIVFYTNMVQHPNFLSIQVLPKELKKDVEFKLLTVKSKVPTFKLVREHPILLNLTNQQIDGIISYMWAQDLNNLWQDCVSFNRRLDRSRSTKTFTETTPEFAKYA
jgi:MoaA/NifB/PqqE/SkfB family radical SAM enzyme